MNSSFKIEKILEELSNQIQKEVEGNVIGLDLSYVDHKEKTLEIFSYSTESYKNLVNQGITNSELGSLLLSDKTFCKKRDSDSFYRPIITLNSDKPQKKETKEFGIIKLEFPSIPNYATHKKWIEFYRANQLRGIYIFEGKRIEDDYDLVLFSMVDLESWKNISIYRKIKIWHLKRKVIKKFIESRAFSVVFERFRESKKELQLQATRAAISQVMARNMSHNIGSHVMNNLINEDWSKKIEELLLKDKRYISKPINEIYPQEKNEQKILLNQIATYNSYVKCRMDYMNEMTFGVPTMQTTKNLYSEVFVDFDKVRLLLNYISGIDNFNFSICFKDKDVEVNDIPVAFPSDILGCQAFYNIIENIIRNTAKHGTLSENEDPVEFTITIKNIAENDLPDKLKEQAKQLYHVEIKDNLPVNGKKKIKEYFNEQELNDYKKYIGNTEEIDDEFEKPIIDLLVAKQNCRINESVLDKENKLRSHSLGLLEMEASAAFLRKIDVPEIEQDHYEIKKTDENIGHNGKHFNILKAFKTNNNCLGYRIFLSKPQEILLVGNFSNLENNKDEELKRYGIEIISAAEFEEQLKGKDEKKYDGKIYHHQFVLYDDTVSDETLKRVLAMNEVTETDEAKAKTILSLRTQLPVRCLNIKEEQWNELINKINANADQTKTLQVVEELLWGWWMKGREITVNNYEIKDTPFNSVHTKQCIILLHHGENYANCFTDTDKKEKLKDDIQYLEVLATSAVKKLPESKHDKVSEYISKDDGFNDLKKSKLLEAYNEKCKILILDERIQQFSNTEYSPVSTDRTTTKIPNKRRFEFMDVKVPDKDEILLSDLSISDKKKEFEKSLNNISDYQFVLIHYGILERIYSDKNTINVKLFESSKKSNIIITSGRGQHSLELPSYVRYINLSATLNIFADSQNLSKYSINYLLNQSRK